MMSPAHLLPLPQTLQPFLRHCLRAQLEAGGEKERRREGREKEKVVRGVAYGRETEVYTCI